MKIAYLLDSSISHDYNDDPLFDDCYFLSLNIILNKDILVDNKLIKQSEFTSKIKKAKKISVSSPSIDVVENLLEKILDDGYDVLVCSLIGSGLSPIQNIVYGSGINRKITIVNLDSKGFGPLQLQAVKMFKNEIEKGFSLLDAQAHVQHMLNVSNCYGFVLDASLLKNSDENGNINSNLLINSLAKIKTIFKCSKDKFGKIEAIDKARTKNQACAKIAEMISSEIDFDEYNIIIAHHDMIDAVESLKEALDNVAPDQLIDVHNISATIGTYTGYGSILVFSVHK